MSWSKCVKKIIFIASQNWWSKLIFVIRYVSLKEKAIVIRLSKLIVRFISKLKLKERSSSYF